MIKELAKEKIKAYFDKIPLLNRLLYENQEELKEEEIKEIHDVINRLEKEYIGTILIAGADVLKRDMPALSVNNFSDYRHRLILDACYKLYSNKYYNETECSTIEPDVDIVSVSKYLEDFNPERLKAAGGRQYINDLAIIAIETIDTILHSKYD